MTNPADHRALDRRKLLLNATSCGVGAGLIAATGSTTTFARAGGAPSDDEILSFALNFEYLGAELYLRALTGRGLDEADTSGVGARGTLKGGRLVPFQTVAIHDLVRRLAEDEVAHVRTLRTRLGRAAIAEPAIDISVEWWTRIAVAAGAIGPGEVFDPYADEISFLKAAYVLEDVCVTALAGAIPLFTRPTDVATATGFLGVEAAQASAIRVVLVLSGQGRFTDAVSALRSSLSGTADDVGTNVDGNIANFVSSANGQVFARTPTQILNIAYGGGAASKFGFFPNRVNGAIS